MPNATLRPILGSILRSVWDVAIGGGGSAWTPAALFAASEQGVWYDPSDLSTMFQDAAGTVPVTGAEQPVGLILDKRLGLALGPELVSNGTFATDISGWTSVTPAQAVATWDSGRLKLANVSGVANGGQTARTVLITVAGAWYEVTGTIEGQSRLRAHGENNPRFFAGAGTNAARLIFKATASTTNLDLDLATFSAWLGAGFVAYLDNISAREIPGNHAGQATSSMRPVLKKTGTVRRINFDGVDDKLTTTFPNLGSNVTIARSVPGVGASILTGQTIGAGAWDDSTNHCGLVIVNRVLTGPETASLTAYLNAKAGV